MNLCKHWCMHVWMHRYTYVLLNARCVCTGMTTWHMHICRVVCVYACLNKQMYACAHVHMKASNVICLHLWEYGVYSHGCTQAHKDIMYSCLHLSNYECVCVHVCIRKYTYAYIHIYTCASMHVCLYTCMHWYMEKYWKCDLNIDIHRICGKWSDHTWLVAKNAYLYISYYDSRYYNSDIIYEKIVSYIYI